ncbi:MULTISPECIES: hypothetical protein [unclassified Kitasatospora]|uniref:hypothetical protein n=1 Tax=unclassified Kitasatospora TaxID=2633591 RepID=UPI0033C34DF9
MDLLPTLLPGDPSCLAAVAVTTYLPAGAFYIALTGIGGIRRPAGPAALLAAVAAAVALTVFWPLLLVTRAIRSLHRRRTATTGPLRLATPTPGPAAPAPLPPKPSEPPVPPRWYRQDYAAVSVALAEGRTAIARTWAGFLADDATVEFGPAHPFTQEAWLLVARTVHAALTDIRAGQPADDAQPIEDPYGYFLFPQAHRGAWDPDRDSVYTSARGQQAVTR